MSDQPLVSIVIPVYNGANYLREAVDSALAQTYPRCEVLVINDGSTDGGATRDISLSYGNRIRYFEKQNGGVASALNLGIREMHGSYFSWLSHDDVYYSNKIAVQIEAIFSTREPVIVYSDLDVIDTKSRLIKRHRLSKRTAADVFFGIIACSSVNACTTLIPKKAFAGIGQFDETLRTTQDVDFLFRLACKYAYLHIDQPLIQSRIHPMQGSLTVKEHRAVENDFYIKAMQRIPQDYLEPRLRQAGSAFFLCLAFHLRRRGFDTAADYARSLSREDSLDIRNGWRWRRYYWGLADHSVRIGFRLRTIRKLAKRLNRWLKLVD